MEGYVLFLCWVFLFFAVGVVASNMLAGAVSIGFRIYGVGLFLRCYFLPFFYVEEKMMDNVHVEMSFITEDLFFLCSFTFVGRHRYPIIRPDYIH